LVLKFFSLTESSYHELQLSHFSDVGGNKADGNSVVELVIDEDAGPVNACGIT
jgi:hypothetical protein